MFKIIPSFQSFFIANQTQATASPSFARINNKGEESGRAKSQKLKQNPLKQRSLPFLEVMVKNGTERHGLRLFMSLEPIALQQKSSPLILCWVRLAKSFPED